MPKCPNCGTGIGFQASFFPKRLYKNGCPNCGVRLKSSRMRSAVIGGIGGGTGTYIFGKMFRESYSVESIIYFLIWFAILLLAAYYFIGYKIVREDR